MVHGGLRELIYLNNCITTFVWFSSGLLFLKSNELSSMVKTIKVRTYLLVRVCAWCRAHLLSLAY
jgi:hypothetical protein